MVKIQNLFKLPDFLPFFWGGVLMVGVGKNPPPGECKCPLIMPPSCATNEHDSFINHDVITGLQFTVLMYKMSQCELYTKVDQNNDIENGCILGSCDNHNQSGPIAQFISCFSIMGVKFSHLLKFWIYLCA